MTKFKQGNPMTTTEIDEIMKQVESAMPIPYHLNRIDDKTHILHLVRTAIASVIGKEMHTIRERPDKLILDKADELYGESPSLKECHAFREGCKWMYKYLLTEPLSDLTPKTDTTDGE